MLSPNTFYYEESLKFSTNRQGNSTNLGVLQKAQMLRTYPWMGAIFWCLLTQDSHIWQLGRLADAYTDYLMTETRWLSVPPSRMV